MQAWHFILQSSARCQFLISSQPIVVVGLVGVEYVVGLMEVEYMMIYGSVVTTGGLTESAYSLDDRVLQSLLPWSCFDHEVKEQCD